MGYIIVYLIIYPLFYVVPLVSLTKEAGYITSISLISL